MVTSHRVSDGSIKTEQHPDRVVENAYGRLKGRCRCLLKRSDVATCRVPTTVGACCTLHNICETHGEAFNEDWQPSSNDDVDVGGNDGDNDARGIQYRLAGVANRIRNVIRDSL